MGRFIKRISIFFGLLIFISYPISVFISKNFNTYTKQNWILQTKGRTFDYAALGSSRVANIIDINTIDGICGTQGINIGTSGSNYAENLYLLDNFIKRNKINHIILNVDEFSFNSKKSFGGYTFHYFEFLQNLGNNEYAEIFKDYIPNWKYYLYKTVPITKYLEFNDRYTLKTHNKPALDKNKGTNLKNNSDNAVILSKKRHIGIDSLDVKYFNRILKLCNKNDINVILCTTPIHSKPNPNSTYLKYIKENSMTQTFDYYSYSEIFAFTNQAYFNDATHTNIIGSLEYSKNLGEKLKQSLTKPKQH